MIVDLRVIQEPRSAENSQGETHCHLVVGYIDNLGDLEIASNAGQDVCLAATESLGRDEPLDEVSGGTLRRLEKVWCNAQRTESAQVGERVRYLGPWRGLELGGCNPGLVFAELEAEGSSNGGFDGSATDLAMALSCVAVTAAEQGPGGLNGQVDDGTHAQLAAVQVATRVSRRDGRQLVVVAGRQTHAAEEGPEGNPHVLELGVALLSVERPDLDLGHRVVFCQQTEAGNDGRPAPVGDFETQHLDLEDVAGLSVLHEDRAEDGIGDAEIELLNGRGVGLWGQLTIAAVDGIKGDGLAG